MKIPPFKIIPLRAGFLEKVRKQGIDDQNQSVEFSIAAGGEPCRDVMRVALPGERIILASYCPFTHSGPYKEYGPVFLLAQTSDENPDMQRLPMYLPGEQDISKEDDPNYYGPYLGENFILKGYSNDERIVDAKLATPQSAYNIISAFFERPDITFVMARYTAFGCYSLRLERQ